ncbi:carboxylesterase family protein [Streptomyces asiaticus]
MRRGARDRPYRRRRPAVLRWVRDNIVSFGGDPRAVTVGGQSAGAYSALSLAVDPATGGLVSRVLLQSGPWGLPPQSPEQAAEAAEEYRRLLGIPRGPEPGQALRELPVEHLPSAYGELAVRLGAPRQCRPSDVPGPGRCGDSAGLAARGLGRGAGGQAPPDRHGPGGDDRLLRLRATHPVAHPGGRH